ncbi:MAG: DUF4956 domain-containing protein, partial [Verrucomicrobiota bacterium]
MDDFLTAIATSQYIGLKQIATAIMMAFVLSSVYATVYRWTFNGLSYSRTFIHTMVLGSMVVAMVIMAIGNNLARGLGILGTLAIVRFRTPIRDPRDMVFLFVALGTGIACGARTYSVAIVGTGMISAAALLLHWSPFASRRDYEGLLRFILPADKELEGMVQDVMRSCCSSFYLIAMREAVQGELIEYSYQIRLLDPSYQGDLIKSLHEIEAIE